MSKVVDHYGRLIRELDAPPIVMGHSIGGTITQLLVDRGLSSAAVGAFGNTISREESDRVYERYHVPAANRVVGAPGVRLARATWNSKAGRHNAEKYRKSSAVTEFKEFPGRPHFSGAPGWEEVADYALDWALRTRRS